MGVRIERYRVELVRESAAIYDLDSRRIREPRDAAEVIHSLLNVDSLTVEHFGVLTLDTKNVVIGFHILHIGSLNTAVVDQRSIFQAALLNNAAGIILFHNHPSGDTEPSNEDVAITNKVAKSAELLGINMLDHIIVCAGERALSIKGYLD